MSTLYTIGHSTRPIEAFIALLRLANTQLAVDVRTVPKSRHNPQFNTDALAHSLHEAGIEYRHLAALGGLRPPKKGAGPSPNSFWENEAFRNYAGYTASEEFRRGLSELRALARDRVCTIFCAEAVWWRCHRRIIADYLLVAGESVIHILDEGHLEEARLTEAAQIGADGVITYPAAQGDLPL